MQTINENVEQYWPQYQPWGITQADVSYLANSWVLNCWQLLFQDDNLVNFSPSLSFHVSRPFLSNTATRRWTMGHHVKNVGNIRAATSPPLPTKMVFSLQKEISLVTHDLASVNGYSQSSSCPTCTLMWLPGGIAL